MKLWRLLGHQRGTRGAPRSSQEASKRLPRGSLEVFREFFEVQEAPRNVPRPPSSIHALFSEPPRDPPGGIEVAIYRPCRGIMSAETRSKERPSHDPSALSTFQSFRVLRIRILEGWRPPSSIHSSLLEGWSPPARDIFIFNTVHVLKILIF